MIPSRRQSSQRSRNRYSRGNSMDRRNHFRKWLVDEIRSKSNAGYSDILKAIDEFMGKADFDDAYEKWCHVMKVGFKNQTSQSIKEILRKLVGK